MTMNSLYDYEMDISGKGRGPIIHIIGLSAVILEVISRTYTAYKDKKLPSLSGFWTCNRKLSAISPARNTDISKNLTENGGQEALEIHGETGRQGNDGIFIIDLETSRCIGQEDHIENAVSSNIETTSSSYNASTSQSKSSPQQAQKSGMEKEEGKTESNNMRPPRPTVTGWDIEEQNPTDMEEPQQNETDNKIYLPSSFTILAILFLYLVVASMYSLKSLYGQVKKIEILYFRVYEQIDR